MNCSQLTFGEMVYDNEWDVWDDYVVYKDESTRIKVVNAQNRTELVIPNIHPDLEYGTSEHMLGFFPAVYQDKVAYTIAVFYGGVPRTEIVNVELSSQQQEVISYVLYPEFAAKWVDYYGDVIVSAGGCGATDSQELCLYRTAEIDCGVEPIVNGAYGSYNSVWEDTIVWYSSGEYNIHGYRISEASQFEVTEDTEIQMKPKVHGDHVVYMDLRHGDSDGFGDWNHAAVYLYGISTKETKQIAGGEWIASYPDIWGNTVVWMDYRNCTDPNNKNDMNNVEIWGYDITTEQQFQLTNLPGRRKAFPKIWENYLYFLMFHLEDSGTSIYRIEIESKKN